MSDLAARIDAIEERNRRVEADKAWEVSLLRRGTIALVTYLTASLFLWLIEAKEPFISALVPTGGYGLSTLSLPFIKRYWLARH